MRIEDLKLVLSDFPRVLDTPRRKAGVVVPLLEKEGDWVLLFERRVDDGSIHGGQVCFPGGSVEPHDENILHTALREMEEEIGVKRGCVDILGFVEPIFTLSSNFVIYPFVGVLSEANLTVNESEVSRVFTVPFHYIVNLHPFEEQTYEYGGGTHTTFVIRYEGEVIWGATSRILDALVRRVKRLL